MGAAVAQWFRQYVLTSIEACRVVFSSVLVWSKKLQFQLIHSWSSNNNNSNDSHCSSSLLPLRGNLRLLPEWYFYRLLLGQVYAVSCIILVCIRAVVLKKIIGTSICVSARHQVAVTDDFVTAGFFQRHWRQVLC